MDNYTVISDFIIDDIIALFLLKKLSSKQINNLITTFGNIPEETALNNAKEYIRIINNRWNLSRGANLPASKIFKHQWFSNFNGSDGLWNIHPQVDVSKVRVKEKQIKSTYVFSIGALTEIYDLINKYKNEIEGITLMGGVFHNKGNFTQYAECNIAYDPESANLFFSNVKQAQTIVIPLDVTNIVFWEKEVIDKIPESDVKNIWLKNIIKAWYKNYGSPKNRVLKLHDPLAVYLTFFPYNAEWVEEGIEVILNKEQRARTIFNKDNPLCKIALELKNPEKISQEIFNNVFYD